MTVLRIVMICAVVVLVLSLVRVGVWMEYNESGLLIRLKIGVFSVQVFPVKPKEKKRGKPHKEKKRAQQPEEQPKKGGTFELVKEFLPLAAEAAGELKRKISIDRFYMDLLWSVPDPAACAMGFGGANAAVGMIWPLIEQNFHVKDHRIRTAVNFDLGKPTVYLLACTTIRIGQLISFGVCLAVKGFKAYRAYKTKESIKQKEAV